jgi:hypothetical protein
LWNWSPRAIASVLTIGTFGEPNLEIATRVATTLRTDVDKPITMPFSVPAQPDMSVSGAIIDHLLGYWTWTVAFNQDNSTNDLTQVTRLISVFTARPPDSLPGTKARLGGYPAVVNLDDGFATDVLGGADDNRSGTSVTLLGDHTYTVKAWVSGPGTSVQTATDLALSAEFATNPTDESMWPTAPIR